MSTCGGCGGQVGRDCFNPTECEWITRDMEERANQPQERSEGGGPMMSDCQGCGTNFYGYGYMGEPCSEGCYQRMTS